jgi:hypothetical protein
MTLSTLAEKVILSKLIKNAPVYRQMQGELREILFAGAPYALP